MIKTDQNLLGITGNNAWSNIFSYSLLAAHSLDMAASAAGRIDTEAARYLRMAQGMIRTRTDILARQSFYVSKKVDGRQINLKIAPQPLEAYSRLQVATSQDSAVMQKAENADGTRKDIEGALLVIAGEKYKIEGVLISNLVEIVKAERAFYQMPIDKSAIPISKEQKGIMSCLQISALVIADIISQSIEMLKNKLAGYRDLYICASCGLIYYEIPEKCEICEAGQSLIVKYPLPIRGEIKEFEKEFYERYNQPK